MGLAHQRGNKVTLSYRKASFSRIKERNAQRIRECIDSRTLTVIFDSIPTEIREKSVVLEIQGRTEEIPNDYVWVFAGGTPPNTFLQKIGVQLGMRDMTREARDEAAIAMSESKREAAVALGT
jgi:thioredoxin reductase (NADPH)